MRLKQNIKKYQMTVKNFSNFRIIMYGVFKRAKKKKYINFSITEIMEDMEISKRSFKKVIRVASDQIYDPQEKNLIESYLENHKDIYNLGLLLIFKTGLRIGELSTIKIEEIDNYTIPINRTEIRYKDDNGKSCYDIKEFPKSEAGLRYAILPEKYKWILDEIMATNPKEYLFENNGKRIRTYSFRKRLDLICKSKLNIPSKSPHKIRKTYGTILLDGKIRELTILETMGHADIAVTKEHYYFNRTNIEDKRRELDSIKEL